MTDLTAAREYVKRQCSIKNLDFHVEEGFDSLSDHHWMAVEVAAIHPCCEENDPGVMWTAWHMDDHGVLHATGSHEYLCGGCGYGGTRNSHLSKCVFLEEGSLEGWQARIEAIINECLEFRSAYRADVERSLRSEIDDLLTSGEWMELGTDSEAATVCEDGIDRAVWRAGDSLQGFCGWGESSGVDDIFVNVRIIKHARLIASRLTAAEIAELGEKSWRWSDIQLRVLGSEAQPIEAIIMVLMCEKLGVDLDEEIDETLLHGLRGIAIDLGIKMSGQQ